MSRHHLVNAEDAAGRNVEGWLADPRFDRVELLFTDIRGSLLRLSWARQAVTPELIANGVHAAALTPGWRTIDNCDFLFRPDVSTLFVDPLSPSALSMFADAWEPDGSAPYERDPRLALRRAQDALAAYVAEASLQIGAELEFHIFEDVRHNAEGPHVYSRIVEREGPENARIAAAAEARGHTRSNRSHHLSEIADYSANERFLVMQALSSAGLEPVHCHHEAGANQAEISIAHRNALHAADAIQLQKRITRAVVAREGRLATFMPMPVAFEPGNGMHFHVSIQQRRRNLFAAEAERGKLSSTALHAMAGVLKHARALCAFLNTTPNSYARLQHLYPMAAKLAYGYAKRTAQIRVPYFRSEAAARFELRFGDCTANPYLALAAVSAAMLDGMKNKLDPGAPSNEEPPWRSYDPRNRVTGGMPRDLDEAILALEADKEFLLRDGVFTEDLIEQAMLILCRNSGMRNGRPHVIDFSETLDC